MNNEIHKSRPTYRQKEIHKELTKYITYKTRLRNKKERTKGINPERSKLIEN